MSDQEDILQRLARVIRIRKEQDPDQSYVASLFKKGKRKIAEKLGEEAVELAVASVSREKQDVVAESADLIFHLLILLEASGLSLEDVRDELARREGLSGIEEKRRRHTKQRS